MSVVAASTVADALSAAEAAALRGRVDAAGFRPWWLADRGRYQVNDSHQEPELWAALVARAAARFSLVAPRVVAATWTRHVAGDYAVHKDDQVRAAALGPHLEVTLDFSEGSAPDEAQIVWHDDQTAFVLSQKSGSAALVDRRHAIARYERYLNHRVGAAVIHRLRLTLAP